MLIYGSKNCYLYYFAIVKKIQILNFLLSSQVSQATYN